MACAIIYADSTLPELLAQSFCEAHVCDFRVELVGWIMRGVP
jgi:hypothetical protein